MSAAVKKKMVVALEALERIANGATGYLDRDSELAGWAAEALVDINNPRRGEDDLTGYQFGKLTVLAVAPGSEAKEFWTVQCECGTTEVRKAKSIRKSKAPWAACRQCEPALQKALMPPPKPFVFANPNHVRGCTGKRRFDSEGTAVDAAAMRAAKHGPSAAYGCDHCGGWHITRRLEPSRWGVAQADAKEPVV